MLNLTHTPTISSDALAIPPAAAMRQVLTLGLAATIRAFERKADPDYPELAA
jgi:hypothetical protein